VKVLFKPSILIMTCNGAFEFIFTCISAVNYGLRISPIRKKNDLTKEINEVKNAGFIFR